MKLVYPACFYQDKETGGYAVVVPDLPGCVSGGPTLADAMLQGEDAASGWVLGELEDGKPVPAASRTEDIHPDEGGFVSLLVLDMDTYTEKYGEKVTKKNLAIPAWLNTFAEEQRINFSRVLQDALMNIYDQAYA